MSDSESQLGQGRARALHGYYFEDLVRGMRATFSKRLTEAEVRTFAAISGDDNPLHVDAEFAATTRVGQQILHGMLTASPSRHAISWTQGPVYESDSQVPGASAGRRNGGR